MQLLAGIGPFGVPELLIIAFIVVLVFGVGRLPEVGGAVGKSIREFRKATKDESGAPTMASDSTAAPAADMSGGTTSPMPSPGMSEAGDTIFCGECGTKNAGSAKFCSQCGHAMGAPVG